ncbi:heavy metal translocating P-type ATPase [Arsenicitalea aurantiaca]|uniref:P-type Zn(2+) transporter n=1 Tax=Arsenicitalea aurantiaca TaxID=1783274 RepID=A0A433XLY2_9HYPH|nr:heavy metal translocating P-type ATPase [Arsenicitalea aurantiaca]RUT35063.1 heavy metal translocating P-type ATPase [Arsenicitalea aurantiaca]
MLRRASQVVFERKTLLGIIASVGLAGGGILWLTGRGDLAALAWAGGTAPVLLALFFEIVTSLRRGDVGLDIVAALSMSAALAFGEPLAGNVVALMYAGGQILETYAQGRARNEMSALLGRVARTAMRYAGDRLEEIPIDTLAPGDVILIRHGETLPVDGRVDEGEALLDLSALTGEAVPERILAGGEALSGATSVGPAFRLRCLRPAAASTYAGIVRLVEAAQQSHAPMARLADRYAIWFLALTLLVAGGAWGWSGDPVRALSVLVVATPCPLILAVPVALISGLSRAARSGALIKSGGMLEALAQVKIGILDKTGTLTHGRARVTDIISAGDVPQDEILRLAASLDQASAHVVANALIDAATARDLPLSPPRDTEEQAGTGIEGWVGGRKIALGGNTYVSRRSGNSDPRTLGDGLPADAMTVAVAIDGTFAGLIVLRDQLRPDAGAMLGRLRAAGIARLVLASGDRPEIATAIGRSLALDRVEGGLDPAGKVAIIAQERAAGPVMMVGDGVNDAPALAAADVGVAMGARGTAASSEAAGVVLLVDALEPLARAVEIARRSRRIALQSVVVGLGLSLAAMGVAALGYLPPVQGALLQEAIDVAVILNALRALR